MRVALVVLALLAAAPAQAGVRVVAPFDPADYADRAAVGLLVPGAGPTVTREAALAALLRGKLEHGLLGGIAAGENRIELGAPGEPEILVSLPPPGRSDNDVRYPIALLGERGLLTSDSTRIDGLVSVTDVATGRLRVVENDDPAQALEELDDRIERNSDWRLPLTIALAALLIALAIVRPRYALRALLVALAANLWLSPLLAVAAGVAVLLLPLGWACAAILLAYLVSMGLDPETVALSPFGPSQSGRFYGINNLLETMLLAPALLGAALLGRAGILVAGLAFVTIGGNRFGADGGGIVVLAVAYLVLWLRLRGEQPSWRLAGLVAAGAVALALALLGLDAATGGSSHVTDAVGDGPAALAGDIADRIELSVRRTAASLGATAVVLGSLAILVAVALRARRSPVLDAFLVGIAVSLVVNDTPGDVLGMGAAIAIALARYTPEHGWLSSGPMRRAAALLATARLLARSGRVRRRGGGLADARDDRGHGPDGDDHRGAVDPARVDPQGRPLERSQGLRRGRMRRLPHVRGGRVDGQRRPQPRRRQSRFGDRGRARHQRPGRDALVLGQPQQAGNRRRRCVRLRDPLRLPDGIPRDVAAIACDLDRTLTWQDGVLRPRTAAALRAAGEAGIHVVIATGRMYRSVRPYAEAVGVTAPLVCYQGAAVVDPVTGEWLLHEPIPLELAREAIAAVEDEGFALNCYVDDDLYVAAITEHARSYADFQSIPLHEVGDLLGWIERPPTKLVVVDDPARLDELRPRLEQRFGERLYIAKSLPYFLELASPAISKGSGLAFVAEHVGFTAERTIAFGDGENDLELLDWAGFGIAVENADDRLKARADWICPSAEEEGVAQVLEALLHLTP